MRGKFTAQLNGSATRALVSKPKDTGFITMLGKKKQIAYFPVCNKVPYMFFYILIRATDLISVKQSNLSVNL